jgi:hypothetical protein
MQDPIHPVDEVLGALVKRLQVMPASDPQLRAAILARVRGRRQGSWRAALAMAWQPSVPVLAAATIAVAALGLGYTGRVLVEPAPEIARNLDASGSGLPLTTQGPVMAANDGNAVRFVPTQFLLSSRGANRVALVGDFNAWDPGATVLQDPTRTGVWEVTVPLPPGVHKYAFLVNDSLWTVDPRAPKVDDPDFGRANSVILVNGR